MDSPKLISIAEWRKRFCPPPTITTVLNWIKHGKIIPPPVRHGRSYYLADNACYVNESANHVPSIDS